MNVLSLFDGISCGQVALRNSNIKIDNYYASEIDEIAIGITQNNFPNTIQLGDVSKITKQELPQIDLLIGGSPCQGFSFLGNQLNFDDERSKLFFEYTRLKNELNPKWFLFENVRMRKKSESVITNYLNANPIKINSKISSPTSRTRLYWTNIDFNIIEKETSFDDVFDENANSFLNQDKISKIRKWNANRNPLDYSISPDTKATIPCLLARGYNQYHRNMILVKVGNKYRYLSNNEAELAMGLPKDYTKYIEDIECSNSQRSKVIGNGWSVQIIEQIFKGIK